MERATLFALLVATMLCRGEAASVFSWIWGKGADESTVLVADGVPLVSIPYESMTEDEKFLQEAAKFTEIQVSSPLETCQHKVIMRIRTSCSAMTEEELAKLSVNLLNCQSAVEGRKMFPCTEEMSLKQCTTDMDADMWNAYHLMSNRARAVCYAARSTQFRALTELTVNKLMQTAHTQIKTLGSLKDSQDRLEEQTVQVLSSLTEGNQALLEQQQHLKDAQAAAYNIVSRNLRDLSNEKALIKTGHTQLAAMVEDIGTKLEDQQEVLQNMMIIQEQAWAQYEHTLQKLAQINETIQFIWNITNTMRTEMDQKLDWLTDYIGDTGEQMHKMYRTGLHIVYLLCAMIVSAFLQAPLLTRITILGIVPLNLASYLKHGMEACLDFTSLTALIFLITAMHFLMVGIQRLFGPKAKIIRPEPVQFINQNGHTNGAAQNYSHANLRTHQAPSISLYAKLRRSTWQLYNIFRYQTNCCIQKCGSLVQSLTSWSRQGLTQREELSCSYMPSRKTREDLVSNFDYPSLLSDDVTDFENSNAETDRSHFDELHNLVDANELRRRLRRIEGSVSSSTHSYQQSPSRSATPSYGSTRAHCIALTKSGRRCRLTAMNDQNFCSRHSDRLSVMGD